MAVFFGLGLRFRCFGAALPEFSILFGKRLRFRGFVRGLGCRRAEAAEAKAKAEKERQRTAERERDCVQARSELAALESGQRVSRFNSRGEREVLDDAGRADQIARTRKFVESDCK